MGAGYRTWDHGYRTMKKVGVWLSNEERDALQLFCEKEGRSMYSVLKEASLRIIQGESSISLSQDDRPVAPSVKRAQVVSPIDRSKSEERLARLERETDRTRGNEQLWTEMSELKAGLGELRGLVSALLLKLTKTEELETKLDGKIEDTVTEVIRRALKMEDTE